MKGVKTLVRTCENCLYGQEPADSPNYCGGGFCKHHAPLSLELSDDEIQSIVERNRKEYYNAWLEYISEDN